MGEGETEEQVMVVVEGWEGGRDRVFLSEASLNTEHLPDSLLEAKEPGREGTAVDNMCSFMCVKVDFKRAACGKDTRKRGRRPRR